MIRSAPAALAALTLWLAACGDDAAAPPPPLPPPPPPADAFTSAGACDSVASLGSCARFTGMSATALEAQRSVCRIDQGTFGEACPAADDLGACLIPSAFGMIALHVYAPRYSAAAGGALCGHGAWQAVDAAPEPAAALAVSCQDPYEGTCADVTGEGPPVLRSALQRNCLGNDLTLLAGPCPAAGRSGTCTTRPGVLAWRTRHYAPATAATDRAVCGALGGTWTDG